VLEKRHARHAVSGQGLPHRRPMEDRAAEPPTSAGQP
jgi:hypothetical protein